MDWSSSIFDTPEIAVFRAEVRSFLKQSLTPELREEAARQTGLYVRGPIGREWHHILYEKGWITPTWPLEFGGQGWTPIMKYVFEQECAMAGTPTPSSAALLMCGPIIMACGTPEQQARFLPRMRSGEDYWCQGYSEPGAGSDLSALSCRAVRDGDDYVIQGNKIWTTHAHFADWIFMLVRTDSSGRPQEGITFLLADMRSPGITIDPIISMSGEHEVNQVFFDEVRVPVANRVGEEGQGWAVAKQLLQFERSGTYGPKARRILANTRWLASQPGGRWSQPSFRHRFAEISIEVDGLEASELRTLSAGASHRDGRTVSLMKLAGTEMMQRATELCMAAGGSGAAYLYDDVAGCDDLWPGAVATARYLNARAATIYGGSSEVQRNLLAKTMAS